MAPARSSKRQKLSRKFAPGSIVRVEVNNFMTYGHAVIEPGPKLNLILGPNGTGKSSFVCALGVGLAGNTKILGRAEDISSFVRRGTSEGWVEITLAGEQDHIEHKIKRKIFANRNNSEWFINGRSSPQKDVIELTTNLNIQLDNLCQFLPQEKVGNFARMKPVELLEATESAIGDASLAKMHERLIDWRDNLDSFREEEQVINAALERLREENLRVERAADQIRRRERLLQEATILRKKIPWARYQQALSDHKKEKDKLKEEEKKLLALERRLKRQRKPLIAKEAELATARTQEAAAANRLNRARELCDNSDGFMCSQGIGNSNISLHKPVYQALGEVVTEVEKKIEELNHLQSRSEDWHRSLSQLQESIGTLEKRDAEISQNLARLEPEILKETHQNQRIINDLSNQIAALHQDKENYTRTKYESRKAIEYAQEKMKRFRDKKQQRLMFLERNGYNRGIVAAWEWIQSHKSKFRGRVYGPLAMEVEVHSERYAATLEQQIPTVWWSRFFVEFEEDLRLLKEELRRRFNYEVNISHFRGNSAAQLRYPLNRSKEYARFGVIATLDEVFQAPDIVKHALNDVISITSTFLMKDSATQEDCDAFFKYQPQAHSVWIKDAQIRRKVSVYNPQASSKLFEPLRPSRFLVSSFEDFENDEESRLNATICDRMKESDFAEAEIGRLETEIASITNRKREIMGKQRYRNQELKNFKYEKKAIGVQLRNEAERLQAEKEKGDPLKLKPKLQEDLDELLEKGKQHAVALSQAYSSIPGVFLDSLISQLTIEELKDQVGKMNEQEELEKLELSRAKEVMVRYRKRVEQMEHHTETLWNKAKEATGWPMPQEIAQNFENQPDDPDELMLKAQEAEETADEIIISDPGALDRWKRKCQEIADKTATLEDIVRKRQEAEYEIGELKSTWTSRLRSLVSDINKTFSESFSMVGCAGEVAFVEDPNEDFRNYAIEIRVKFRESEPLSTLDANRQSGGERSVSTMLFIIALQGIAASPFRVVDEINQGMDQVNERKIFELLSQSATQPESRQCFLLTPKLLPDLPFNKNVTVLQIMNGPLLGQIAKEFSFEKLLGQKRVSALQA